jgi:uncharacterized alpha-E superfamily protein
VEWYRVTKTIKGRKYDYWQKTYRAGGSVKTMNKYIGPNANPPRMPSLQSMMANKSDAHKALRKQYDAGKITKIQYLEALATNNPRSIQPKHEEVLSELHTMLDNIKPVPRESELSDPESRRENHTDTDWREYLREQRERKREYEAGMKIETANSAP